MKKRTYNVWTGVALAAIGTGAYLLLKDQRQLLQQAIAGAKSLLGPQDPPQARAAAPIPTTETHGGQQPSPENGHVQDVIASNPPPPSSGSNFTVPGEVHGPQE